MADKRRETVFDTTQQHLGSIYAKALLGAAENAGSTEAVLEELESLVADALVQVPGLEGILTSPRVPLEAKESMLDRAFKGKLSDVLVVFLKVVAQRGRFDCLRAIAHAARDQYNELRGRVKVQVRSAAALDDAARELVASQLQTALGRDVDLQLDVAPDLIAGLVIRVGDTVYDGSVANGLQQLRNSLLARTSEKIRGELDRFAVAE